ncbi:hypothetical protein [Pseudomonas fluorescens]|jgi:hypothetical protein|uniref:Uncharacterized protein n=1 Tax=Pseudomonas fluorescens TaxID=294 RepID=A0A5E7UJC5_PSEFL|nr:hypothetical protein [Pseudomonas fluorescens]VVQ10780.1 hypothetical protein PS922_04746 [Pseudomonas fluorescens]
MNIKQPEPAPVLAAWRALNLCNHPERRPTLCCHVVLANGEPACGLDGGNWVAAYTPEPAERVPEDARCQRHGCKERWPAPVYK